MKAPSVGLDQLKLTPAQALTTPPLAAGYPPPPTDATPDQQREGEVDLRPTAGGLLILPVTKPSRQGWDERFQAALASSQTPEGELLEGFSDDAFEETEWQW